MQFATSDPLPSGAVFSSRGNNRQCAMFPAGRPHSDLNVPTQSHQEFHEPPHGAVTSRLRINRDT
jgi:hypothetical protein